MHGRTPLLLRFNSRLVPAFFLLEYRTDITRITWWLGGTSRQRQPKAAQNQQTDNRSSKEFAIHPASVVSKTQLGLPQ